jgi:polyether ionophore transport system permease protein
VSSLTGTGALIRLMLRRDRVRIPVWVLAIGLSVMGSVASFARTYPTAADRQVRARILDNAVASLFVGPGYGRDNYTYGAMTANELLPLTAVAVALMSIFLVVRHTRAEEEAGRADLIGATAVGCHATTVATLAVVGGTNLVLATLLTVGLPASLDGLSTSGSLAFAAALAAVGFVFTGVALLVAQLTVSARAALGISSIAMGAAYVVRAVGDMGGGAPSWLSPFGWATETRAYVDERWWTLLISGAAAVGFVAAAIAIGARRDVGAGVLADRPGPAGASRWLGSPLGLAFRLQRASVLWWTVSLFLLGAAYGGVADQAAELYEDVDTLDEYLARIGAADPADQYLALTLFIAALIAAGFAIQSTLRLRAEESSGRAESILVTPKRRGRWVGSHLVIALAGSGGLLLAYGLGAGITRAGSGGDAGDLPKLIGAALAYTPALWVFAGLATLLFGLAPRLVGVAWAVLGALAFIGFLGPVLHLPDWVFDVSPVEHVPRLPVADLDLAPLAVLAAVAAGLLATGLAAFRRRDLSPG